MIKFRISVIIAIFFAIASPSPSVLAQSEEVVKAWSNSLRKNVIVSNDGSSSTVDYSGIKADRKSLKLFLDSASSITKDEFESWGKSKQLAFLINSYNAWTVEFVLSGYPGIQSIKDLGGLLQSPWKKKFIPLLGAVRSLDEIEHELIRQPGKFNEPRIHFAVNCASVGCPALSPSLYSADTLEAQLEQATRQFLMDRSRNRFELDQLKISSIFKWYRQDFEQGWRGASSLNQFLAMYASSLALDQASASRLAAGKISIAFLDYDWRLNSSVGPR